MAKKNNVDEFILSIKDNLIREISAKYGFDEKEVNAALKFGTRGSIKYARLRQILMYSLHIDYGFPASRIAVIVNRDRTTVEHAVRQIEDLREKDEYIMIIFDKPWNKERLP